MFCVKKPKKFVGASISRPRSQRIFYHCRCTKNQPRGKFCNYLSKNYRQIAKI